MTEGTNKGLFIVVAIVIFGIFVGLSYLIFEDTLSPTMVELFEKAFGDNKDEEPTVPETDSALFTYAKNSTGLTITGYTGTETAISIPSKATFEGTEYSVTEIVGGRMSTKTAIKEVIIPDTVTKIGYRAFTGYHLEKLTLGKNVKLIGDGAFADNDFKDLIIPDSVEIIEQQAFIGNKVENIVIGNGVKSISYMLFYDNPNIKSIKIGNSVETIEKQAFSYGGSSGVPSLNTITELNIPSSVKNIGYMAFYNRQIDTLITSNGLETLNEQAFGYSNLKKVVISDTVKTIGPRAFYSNHIEKLTLGNQLETIDTQAFQGSNIESLIIPDSVITIKSLAFERNKIQTLTLGNSLETIEYNAFSNNVIEELEFPNSLKTIDSASFVNNKIAKINFGTGLTTLNSAAFYNNPLLKNVEIPSAISLELAKKAFDAGVLITTK